MNKEKFPFTCCNCKLNFSIVRGHPPSFVPRNPLLVKCGHSICESCVQRGLKQNGTVICNLCASVTSTREGFSVELLRREFPFFKYLYGTWTLRNFYDDCNVSFNLSSQKRPNSKQENKFDPCYDCPLPAFFTCDQCEVNYCKNCFEKVHVTQPQFITHTKSKTKPKSQLTKAGLMIKRPASLCKEHNNPKEFYCIDHDICICAHCAIFLHGGHAVEAIAARNQKVIPSLQESMKHAIEVVARINRVQKSVSAESAVKKFQSKSVKDLQGIEKEAMQRFAKLNGMLQVKENEVFNKIREERASLLGAYCQLEEELANSRNSIESLLKEAKEAIDKKGQNVNVLDLKKSLDEITMNVPSDICVENDGPSVESSYTLEKLTDAHLSAMMKEYLDNCFEINCPTLPKVKLISAKDISDQVREKDSAKDSETISSMAKLYGIGESKKEDDTSSQHSRSTSRSSIDSGKSEHVESNDRSSPLILSNTLSALKAGSAELVKVSHIDSPSEFYIQRKGLEGTLVGNIRRFNKYVGISNPETPSSISKGGIYLVQYKDDLNWYRGKVLKTNIEDFPGKAKVIYIDYGNKALVDVTMFRVLPARSIQEPPHAIQCTLFDCFPRAGKWCEEALKKMTDLTNGADIMMHVMNVTETVLEVDIVRVNEINHVSVRDALIFLELASFLPTSVPQKQELPKMQMCAKSNFVKGDILECQLSHSVSPSEFYCVELDVHYKMLLELMNEMTELYSDPTQRPDIVYNPLIGMPVAAKFVEDEKWYRAVITGLPGQRLIDVFYVDFGNNERVSFTDVRILLAKFHRMNTQAIHCSLCDIQSSKKSKSPNKWPEIANRIMEELIYQPARLLIEDVKVINDQPHASVVLFSITPTSDICINALLVQEGAAISTGVNSTVVSFNRVQNMKKLSKLRNYCVQRDSEEESVNKTIEMAAKYIQQPVKQKKKEKKVKEKKSDVKVVSEVQANSEENEISSSASIVSDSTIQTTDSIDSDEAHRIEVRVLSAVSPSQIYVRLHNQEVERHVNKLNASLDEFYTGSVPSPITKWKKHGICVAFNPNDGHWYRSVIQEVLEDSYKVTMKDIGVECEVKKEHLRPIEDKFVKFFFDGSILCHLAGVLAAGGGKWASYSCERFSEELNKYSSVFITKRGQINEKNKSLPIELWVKHVTYGGALEPDVEEWRSMNSFIVNQGLAIPDRDFQQIIAPGEDLLNELKHLQQESSSDITSESYVVSWLQSIEGGSKTSVSPSIEVKTIQVKKHKKKAGANLQESITEWKPAAPLEKLDLEIVPSYVDHNNVIYFHELSCEDTLKQIEQALLQSYKETRPQPQDMFWSVGQPCIAQYHSNGLWYRGKIIKINDDSTYSVQFVDYGNVEECKATELRKRVFLTDLPLYCHCLSLHELKPVSPDGKWPVDVLDFIHSNVVEKTCKVQLEKPDKPGGVYFATSFAPPGGIELSDILVGMHYAIRVSDTADDSSSTLSEDSSESDDVLVVSSRDVNDPQNIEAAIAQKWVDVKNQTGMDPDLQNTGSPPDQTIDSIVASIMKPVGVIDLSSSQKSSIIDALNFKSSSAVSDSSDDEEKINIEHALRTDELTGVPSNMFDSSEVSALTIESLVLQTGEQIKEIFAPKLENLFRDDDELVAIKKKVETEVKNMPVVKVKEFGDFLELPVPQKEEKLNVEVTAIAGLTTFFVQITSTSDEFLQDIQNQYKEMFKEMQAEAPLGRPLLEPFRIGQECCALYDDDDNWYRAVTVARIPDDYEKVMVRFVDFGNKQETPAKNLRPLIRKWMDIPVQCFCVRVHDFEMAEHINPEEAFQLLTEIIFGPLTAVVKEFSNPLEVQLFKAGTDDLVYQPLIDAGMWIKK